MIEREINRDDLIYKTCNQKKSKTFKSLKRSLKLKSSKNLSKKNFIAVLLH